MWKTDSLSKPNPSRDRPRGSPRTARKWLLILPFVGLVLLIGVWRLLIFISERTAPLAGAALPTCVSQALGDRYAKARAEAGEQVQGLMEERHIPGLTVAVAVNGQIVWSEGFGFADKESRIPACPDVQFRIASVSKPLTAAAAALLYEQGKLDLNAPIQQYVPSFPDKGEPITALELATHRSGIGDNRNDPDAPSGTHYERVTDSLERFKDAPLISKPGTRYTYSSYGYVLLSAAIEGASGQDFLSYMHQHVFAPLQMNQTAEDDVRKVFPKRTKFYASRPGGTVVEAPFDDLSKYWAGAGFLSTAEDLVRFGSALVNDDFLKPGTKRLVFSAQTRNRGILGYGLGWMITRDLHLRKVYFHFGSGVGVTSLLACYPRERMCFAMLANLGYAKFPYSRITGMVNPFLTSSH